MEGQFLLNVTHSDVTAMSFNDTNDVITDPSSGMIDVDTYRCVKFVCYRIIMPAILAVGILGNIINLVVLFRQRLQRSMDKMERCATMGFIFLAFSDLIYCLCGFPSAFVERRMHAVSNDPAAMIQLFYTCYRDGVLNTLLLTSTWCVVLIAVERYLVVTHPMKSRSSMRLRRTVILQSVIVVASILLNVPYFCKYSFYWMPNPADNTTTLVVPWPSRFATVPYMMSVYYGVSTVISTLIPVIILTYCNVQLIRAIVRSKTLGLVNKYSTSRITFILVAIIVLYVVLVCPSAVVNVIQEMYTSQSTKQKSYDFLTAVVILNVIQSVNFAINFFLYFGMHPKFRANMRMYCYSCGAENQLKKRLKQYDLVQIRSKCARVTVN